MALSMGSLVVAALALVVSVIAARRQLVLAHRSNVLPVILQAFKESRTPEFSASVEYVLNRLQSEHPHDDGYQSLPPGPKSHVRRVGLFYDDVGKLVAHDVVEEALVLGAYGGNILATWQVLAPYVYSEAAKRGAAYGVSARDAHPLPYFEDLAARAHRTPRASVHTRLGLRRLPPTAGLAAAPTHAPSG